MTPCFKGARKKNENGHQTHRQTSRLLDQIGPVVRFDENKGLVCTTKYPLLYNKYK